ncbi:MAG: Bax inhibitor-1/YccA family protein [Fimbriimonadaceae bacterium]|nr:Bax inhibitor-1/YccA family protein [Fimbriimonadaceae bacterium]
MSNWFRSSNPTMKEEYFTQSAGVTDGTSMTMEGAIGKSALLFVLMLVGGGVGYKLGSLPITLGAFFVALILSFVVVFKKEIAMPVSLIYAPIEGVFLGGISYWYAIQYADTQYKGIVPMAMAATMVVFGTMLALYATRIIKVTETFRTVVIGATLAVVVFYMGSMLIGLAWPGVWQLPVYTAGPIGIGFSVLMVILAAMNFALDFDLIERGVQNRLPKYMEWYAGFALLTTIAWLYFEMLRLISKIARSR